MTYENMIKVIENSDYKNELMKKLKKNKLNLKDLNNLINNCEINCDYDEVLADLIRPWLLYLNKNLNNLMNEIKKENNINEKISLKKINSILNKKIFNNNNNNHKDFDKNFLKEFKNNILNNKKFNYKTKDVNDFYWFNDIPLGLDFLNIDDIYSFVEPKKDAIHFLEEIKNNNLLDNFRIVTSTPNQNVLSKSKHIEKYFSKYINPKQVITTNDKTKFSGLSILIDDAIHNVENAVKKNPFVYAFVLNYTHNLDLKTGKRIIRINSLNEIFQHLPMVILNEYERFQRKDLQNELLFKDKNYKINNRETLDNNIELE